METNEKVLKELCPWPQCPSLSHPPPKEKKVQGSGLFTDSVKPLQNQYLSMNLNCFNSLKKKENSKFYLQITVMPKPNA